MYSFRALAILLIAPAASSLQVSEGLHNLTICNAYAESKPLSIYSVDSRAKLTEEPLRYKQCKLLVLELHEGERLDFKLGGLSVGTFHASHLPFVASSLVLVPFKKKGNGTMAATFASHTFSAGSGDKAQVAVIDAYTGDQPGVMSIKVAGRQNRRLGAAELRPGSAVTLAEGTYDVSLENKAEKSVLAATLTADAGTTHIVLRVGSDEVAQEILVKPAGGDGADESERATSHHYGSGALQSGLRLVAAVAAALLSALAGAAA
jgi:hypothetical protein